LTAWRSEWDRSPTKDTPATAAETPERKRGTWLQRLITHPLVLLLIGGVISGLAATYVTQRWQDHQRAIDTQRAFVTEMTKAVMTDVVALDRFDGALAGYPNGGTGGAAFPKSGLADLDRQLAIADAADEQFVIRAYTIKARLGAYYPHSSVAKKWTALAGRVEGLWWDEQLNYKLVHASGKKSTRYTEFKDRGLSIVASAQAVAKLVLRS